MKLDGTRHPPRRAKLAHIDRYIVLLGELKRRSEILLQPASVKGDRLPVILDDIGVADGDLPCFLVRVHVRVIGV